MRIWNKEIGGYEWVTPFVEVQAEAQKMVATGEWKVGYVYCSGRVTAGKEHYFATPLRDDSYHLMRAFTN